MSWSGEKGGPLSASKLFTSLYWFSYITGLGMAQTHLSLHWDCLCLCVMQVCKKVKIKNLYKLMSVSPNVYRLRTKCKWQLCAVHIDMCLYLPWAAGISGIVKPFKQLRVRGHSDFNHVGVRLHLEGPIVSVKQSKSIFYCRTGNYDHSLIHQFSDSSSDIPGAQLSAQSLLKHYSFWMEADTDGTEMTA